MLSTIHIVDYQSNPGESERVLWVWLLASPAFDGSIHRMVHPRTGILLAFSQWPDHHLQYLHQIQYWNIGISKLKVFPINSGIKRLNMTKAIWWFCSCESSNNWDWTSMYYAKKGNWKADLKRFKCPWIYFKYVFQTDLTIIHHSLMTKRRRFPLPVLGPNI